MFEDTHKLHALKQVKINDLLFNLCYFWLDESIFASDYGRCFVLLPDDKYSLDSVYKIPDLIDYFISFSLVTDLYNSVDN